MQQLAGLKMVATLLKRYLIQTTYISSYMYIAAFYIPMINDINLDIFTMANNLRICKKFKVTCVITSFRREVYENCFFKLFRISGRNVG
jgi:hypothetical protein